MKVRLNKNAKRWGYLTWNKMNEEEFKKNLTSEKVKIYLNNMYIGEKNIDWRHKRISIGYKWTRALDDSITNFIVEFEGNDTVRIECEK